MKQIARNLTDVDEGFLNGTRYLIHDRDPLFTEAFGDVLGSSVRTVNELIEERSDELDMNAAVECRERVGGVLKYYDRRAA